MSLKGDLQDMSLANLVQLICLDQRKATLILKRPKDGEGLIFFEGGQIVHAQVGSLTGEEAIYHLLTWGDGTFEMSDRPVSPDQTISSPWNRLIMEGMRLLDERGAGNAEHPEPKASLTPVEIEQDDALEHEMILLLSEIEQMQIRLTDKKYQKQPRLALQVLTEIINQLASFSETLTSEAVYLDSLENVIARLSKQYPTLRLLRIRHNRLSSEIIAELYAGWTGQKDERRQAFSEIAQGMTHIVETYFYQFIEKFRSGVAAAQWQETCEIFLIELKKEVDKIEF